MIDPIPECWPAHVCLSALWQWIENWQTDKLVRAEPNYLCPDLTLCVWPSMDNSDNGDIWRDITFVVALLRFKRLHFLQQIFLQLMMLVDKGSDVSRLPEMMMLLLHPQLGEEKRIQKRKKHQNKRENASPNWVKKREFKREKNIKTKEKMYSPTGWRKQNSKEKGKHQNKRENASTNSVKKTEFKRKRKTSKQKGKCIHQMGE